jgi:GNAT superfamily N-acetyltransferase
VDSNHRRGVYKTPALTAELLPRRAGSTLQDERTPDRQPATRCPPAVGARPARGRPADRDYAGPVTPPTRQHGSRPASGYATNVTIRPLRRADLPAVVALRRRIWPDLLTTPASAAWDMDHPDPAERARRWVATIDRQIVGTATANRATWTSASAAMVYVGVAPEWRERGIGGRLFERVGRHVADLGVSQALAGVDLGDVASERFMEARGFRHTRDIRTWSLQPTSVSLDALPRLRADAEARGYRLAPVRDLLDRPEDLYRLHAEVGRDVPGDVPLELTYATWRLQAFDTPLFDPDASFCVLDGATPVAMAWIFADREGRRAGNGLTGTLPAHRHRGLARLVKLAALQWLAGHGIEVVYTDNDATNRDMLALNEHLGYRPLVGIGLWARDEGPARG